MTRDEAARELKYLWIEQDDNAKSMQQLTKSFFERHRPSITIKDRKKNYELHHHGNWDGGWKNEPIVLSTEDVKGGIGRAQDDDAAGDEAAAGAQWGVLGTRRGWMGQGIQLPPCMVIAFITACHTSPETCCGCGRNGIPSIMNTTIVSGVLRSNMQMGQKVYEYSGITIPTWVFQTTAFTAKQAGSRRARCPVKLPACSCA